jgi:hypothetical protein
MNRWLKTFLRTVIVVAVPVVLVVMPIRVLMHPRWVYFEYGRPDFPPDSFGFTPQERTRLAITGIESIIGPRGVVVLQEARFADNSPAFNEREEGWVDALAACGWCDAFRHLRTETRAYTWYSPNGRHGFRIDQAFVNAPLLARLKDAAHVWGGAASRGRRDRLSDHAALLVDLEMDAI